ncbi:hypothetical protein QUC31_007028 [Theobroma cacao]
MPLKLMIFMCKALPFSPFFFSFLAEAGQVVQPFSATNGACKWTLRHLVSALALHSYTFKTPGNKINSQVIRSRRLFSATLLLSSGTQLFLTRKLDGKGNLTAVYKVIELDEQSDGREMQQALAEWNRQGTVPKVFVAGKHIGGSDAVVAKYEAGELLHLLVAAGSMPNIQL